MTFGERIGWLRVLAPRWLRPRKTKTGARLGKGTGFLLVAGTLACAGADGGAPQTPPTPTFAEIFAPRGTVELEEPDSALITSIGDLDIDGYGRLLIAEPAAGEARVYDRDGKLSRRLGRRGEGPGEFKSPAGVAFGPGGTVYVSDTGSPRVTRFAPGPLLDATFALPSAYFGGPIRVIGDDVIVFAMRQGPGARLYDVYGPRGERRASFHEPNPLIMDLPGWITAARARLAVGAGSILVAENLLYPILRYDMGGRLVDSIGTAPPSWRPASRPEPGTFQGPEAWSRYARWRRSFTTIAGLAVYRDSLLLVAHESLDPDVLAYEEATYRLDIYELAPAPTQVAQDIPLPGPLLQAGRAVYILLGRPPALDAWTIGRYVVRDAGR